MTERFPVCQPKPALPLVLPMLALSMLGASMLSAACSSDASTANPTTGTGSASPVAGAADSGSADRGEYLVDHVLVCGVCHTPTGADGNPDMTKYLAGSRSYDFTDLDGTIVTVNAENLTSHDPEGLHAWSDEQIRTAITKGIDDEHIAMYPIMPYPEYSLMSKDDVNSIIKYLRSVPPNDNVVAADFPYFDQNPPAPGVDDARIPHTSLASTDPNFASAERGRYLAKMACLNCHTEELAAGVPNLDKAFGGGKIYTFIRGAPPHTSANITPGPGGLEAWTTADIVNAIQRDTEKGTGRTLCNTHPGTPDRLGGMQNGDALDIANYIHSLPPVENGPFQCIRD